MPFARPRTILLLVTPVARFKRVYGRLCPASKRVAPRDEIMVALSMSKF